MLYNAIKPKAKVDRITKLSEHSNHAELGVKNRC
jgi:hypothetical protein